MGNARQLENNYTFTEEDIDKIMGALDQAYKDGTIKTGYRFIQGFLVLVEPQN